MFTYEALNYLIEKDYLGSSEKTISVFLIIVCLLVGAFNIDKWYTSVTSFALGIFLFVVSFTLKIPSMGRFYLSYLFLPGT